MLLESFGITSLVQKLEVMRLFLPDAY